MELRVAGEDAPTRTDAGLLALAVLEGEELPGELASEPGATEARAKPESWALIHPRAAWGPGGDAGPRGVIAVGAGKREELTAERLRVAAYVAAREAGRMGHETLAWVVPTRGAAGSAGLAGRLSLADAAAALVCGTVLAGFRLDRFKSDSGSGEEDAEEARVEGLTLLVDSSAASAAEIEGAAAAAEAERVAAEAQNRARELQATPANHLTPALLAARAAEIAARHPAVTDETLEPEQLQAIGMGGILAVSRGSIEEPRLIVLRYEGAGQDAPTLALIGKAVTFDTGGISLKPPASMHEMKMDMSGGAAVIEALDAIAELGLAANVLAVMPAVENMPSDRAIKPGDVITQYSGHTVEVDNTDAEGRLVLADALAFCPEAGASRMVDLATLTGAVLIALGSTYAGLIANDDELAAEVAAAGERSGDLAWRLPLHEEYRKLIRGKVADLSNAHSKREAGTIYGGAFLEEFAGGIPWAHLDIAGTAWDTGRSYYGDGPTGYGVRLLVELARNAASAG